MLGTLIAWFLIAWFCLSLLLWILRVFGGYGSKRSKPLDVRIR